MHESDPKVAVPMVQRGEFDLAVVHDWRNSPLSVPDGLQRQHLLDDPAEVALPTHHPLAGRASLALCDLASDGWIGAPPGDICHAWLADTLRRGGIEPKVVHYSSEYPTQLALVAAGLGAAVLPRLGRGPLPPGVVAIPVRPTLVRHISVVWRCESARRPAVQAMVAALRTAVTTVGGMPMAVVEAR